MRTLLALTVLLVFALSFAIPAAAQQPTVDTTPTLATDGRGTATLTPDIADFSAGVSRVAPTSRGARTFANRRIAAIVAAVRARGVAEADIRTAGLSIARERVRRRGRPARIRYRAEQSLVIRSRDIPGLGALLDAVATAGADEIDSPDFGFADPSQGRLLATRAALADARRRADDAAAQQGLRVTGIRIIDLDPTLESVGGDQEASAPAAAEGLERKASAPTRVSPGTQEFVERVRVVYTVAPAA